MRNWLFVTNNMIRTFVGLAFTKKIKKTIPFVGELVGKNIAENS